MTKEKWNGRQLLVGIDIGSTTTKVVATDKAGEEILYTDYRRHHANQVQSVICVLKQLNERFPAARIRLALTGSGAKSIADRLGLPFVQEVVANSIALRENIPRFGQRLSWEGRMPKSFFSTKRIKPES